LLIRDRAAFERARNLQAVVFDKTGTLTEGRFGVREVVAFEGARDDDVLRLAAALESQSTHPIARGIVEEARARNLDRGTVGGFVNLTGQGAMATVDGEQVAVVSLGYVQQHGIAIPEASRERYDARVPRVVELAA
jgi:Cu2+-exporting ATPase